MSPLSILVYVSALPYIIKVLKMPLSTPLSYQTARAGSYGYTKQKSVLIDRSIADRLVVWCSLEKGGRGGRGGPA